MKNERPLRFSVIIPVYNNWDQLKLCLNAIKAQSIDNDNVEIIVVDNGSKSPAPDEISNNKNIRFVSEKKPGSYAARNTGASKAKGEILAFTDSDCIPDTDWLKNADKLFVATDCDSIGGEIKIFRSDDGSRYAYVYESYHAFKQKEWVPKGISCTANHFVKKSVFNDVNGFDTTLKSGGDWEFSNRCVDNGYVMKYGEYVIVLHPARKNLKAMMKKHYRHICWSSIIVRKKHNCSQFKLMLSSLKYNILSIFKSRSYVHSLNHRLILFYVDFVKINVQFVVHFLIFLGIVDPNKARE